MSAPNLLLKKDEALESVQAQKDALGSLLEKKNEKVKTSFTPRRQRNLLKSSSAGKRSARSAATTEPSATCTMR